MAATSTTTIKSFQLRAKDELIELRPPEESLPELFQLVVGQVKQEKGRHFRCRCTPLSVDEQRLRRLLPPDCPQLLLHDSSEETTRDFSGEAMCFPEWPIQRRQFGRLSRNRLARKLLRHRRRHRRSAGNGSRMYRLEELLNEAEKSLRSALEKNNKPFSSTATCSSNHYQVQVSGLEKNSDNMSSDRQLEQQLQWPSELRMNTIIRAPTLLRVRSLSEDSGVGFATFGEQEHCWRDEKAGNGAINLRHSNSNNNLEEHIRLRSSKRVQRLVASSLELFSSLLSGSPLFKLDTQVVAAEYKLLGAQELRIYACVECQKLRSALRFHWLGQCLETLFAKSTEVNADVDALLPHRTSTTDSRDPDRLPPIQIQHLEMEREKRIFDYLALLMGQLLRCSYLEAALTSWCELLEHRKSVRKSPRLCMKVELIHSETQLVASDPKRQLKEALSFVVDELGATCRQLPRLETLLDSLAAQDQPPGFIVALQTGDQLMEVTKRRLDQLIDTQIAFNSPGGAWIEHRYASAISILNLFRAGKAAELVAPLLIKRDSSPESEDEVLATAQCVASAAAAESSDIGVPEVDSPTKTEESQEGRLVQLSSACLQLRLLSRLERELCCHLGRYFDAGMVLLDCEPLRTGLLACLERERLLLVRLNLDDLLRLLEQLRLHFDELELGLDLEAAIDEHLADRWQAKQSQQPEQPVILSGDNLVDEDDHNVDDDDLVAPPDVELNPLDSMHNEQEDVEDAAVPFTKEQETREVSEEEEFAYALAGNSGGHQLLALHSEVDPTTPGGGGERRVAPLIECQLLVGRYERLSKLLNQELDPLRCDVALALEGLVFLSEWVAPDDVQPAHWELIAYLSARAQTFTQLLEGSNKRLDGARDRLVASNVLRCGILSKLVLEFHLLMSLLSERKLRAGSISESDGLGSIAQLDSIQEASEWSQKLELRFDFLWRQNALLAEERRLLAQAKLDRARMTPETEVAEREAATVGRSAVLDHWRQSTSAVASFWRLAEEYETQQFTLRLDELEAHCKQVGLLDAGSNLANNLCELRRRLELFQHRRLPIFGFLTNKHLTPAHWQQLAELLAAEQSSPSSSNLAPHLCTTLAQLLELGADRYVDDLLRMSAEASAEHQLTEFLLVESARAGGTSDPKRALRVSHWLERWNEQQLAAAAARFLESRFTGSGVQDIDCVATGARLVDAHDLVRRHLLLRYSLNLDTTTTSTTDYNSRRKSNLTLALRSTSGWLCSPQLVRPSLFLEFLRLFSSDYLERRSRLAKRQAQVENELQVATDHLIDIESLLERAHQLQASELSRAESDGRRLLMQLERDTVRLEIEREVLATREALALDQERRALAARDQCVRQIAERAVPAIRAAARALDCLDGRSLRALRSLRPRPPEPVRLVLEAVCLLRASASGCPLVPERRFDATAGLLHEDYWPTARRMLDGTLSVRLLADLRQLDRRRVAPEVMRLIRRRYLSSSQFQVGAIERVSRDCAQLARWLLAVDVFERVIGVVRPNYRAYLEAERQLAELLQEVGSRRREMEAIGAELRQLEEAFEVRVNQKASLGEKLDQCNEQLQQVSGSKLHLEHMADELRLELGKLAQRQVRLLDRCAQRSACTVYTEAMRWEERRPMADLLSRTLSQH